MYPVYGSSMGMLLLSELMESELDKFFTQEKVQPLTLHMVASKTQLSEELSLVRESGVGFHIEGSYLGVVCVASATRDVSGHAVAAMSISGPLIRMHNELRELFALMVTLGTQAVSYHLGYQDEHVPKPSMETIQALWAEKAELNSLAQARNPLEGLGFHRL